MELPQDHEELRRHPLYAAARLQVLRTRRPSVSGIQRELRLSWKEANQLMRAMEGDVVTPQDQDGCRKVRPAIYIAGPGVFEMDAVARGEEKKAIVRAAGFCPLYPMDNTVEPGETSPALVIRNGNVQMLRVCDLVVADLNPFRCPEPDSGTAWEAGFASGLGKPVFGHISSAETNLQRVLRLEGRADTENAIDKDGRSIENFGLQLNLMLQFSVQRLVIGPFQNAVTAAAADFLAAALPGRKTCAA